MPQVPGLVKGLAVTFRTMLRPNVTVQYPHVKEEPTPRAHGVIALKEENCTVCMLCARECPDWCIYIEGHKYLAPPRREGGKPRQKNALDRFDIDYALCMYCGICVEVCPFEALFWSPEFEYGEHRIADLLHDKDRLNEWMDTVPDFEPYEAGSEMKPKKVPPVVVVAQNIAFGIIAAAIILAAVRVVTTRNIVHAALYLIVVLAGVAAQYFLLGAEFIGTAQILIYLGAIVVLFLFGIMLTRAPLRSEGGLDNDQRWLAGVVAVLILGVLTATLLDAFDDTELPDETVQRTAEVADSVFSTYLVPFEVVSVLLLAALVGAVVIARKE